MDEPREVWRLRREVISHPARQVARGGPSEPTLLEHRAFAQWASFHLAQALGLRGARRHLTATASALRAQSAASRLCGFLEATDAGSAPPGAASLAGAPAAVVDLVAAVAQIAELGSDASRLGAFGHGLPCCRAHQAPVLERLAAATAADAGGGTEAESSAAALIVIRAHLALLDLDLATLRQRGMAMHPSVLRRSTPRTGAPASAQPPPRTQLLPAG